MQTTWVHSFGLAYSDLDRREIREIVTTWKGSTWRCVVLEIGQNAPLNRR